MQEAHTAIFNSAQFGGRSDRFSAVCGIPKLLDSSQMHLNPLIQKGLREDGSSVSSGSKSQERVYLETF